MPSDFDFSTANAPAPEPRRRRSIGPLAIILGCAAISAASTLAAGVVGTAVFFVMKRPAPAAPETHVQNAAPPESPVPGVSNAALDRDYATALFTYYEWEAAEESFWYWGNDASKMPGFSNTGHGINGLTAEMKATTLACELCAQVTKELNAKTIGQRTAFTERHNLDWGSHGDSFTKRFPKRNLIPEQIRKLARKHAEGAAIQLSGELVRFPQTNRDEDFNGFRIDLIKREVPKSVGEVRRLVYTIQAVREMKAQLK